MASLLSTASHDLINEIISATVLALRQGYIPSVENILHQTPFDCPRCHDTTINKYGSPCDCPAALKTEWK